LERRGVQKEEKGIISKRDHTGRPKKAQVYRKRGKPRKKKSKTSPKKRKLLDVSFWKGRVSK